MHSRPDLRWLLEQLLEGLGGVQQIIAELGRQLAQLLLNLIESVLLVSLQSPVPYFARTMFW